MSNQDNENENLDNSLSVPMLTENKDENQMKKDDKQENYMTKSEKKATGNPFEYLSPFKLPTNQEVFLYRESEKQKKLELKQEAANLKIWDKKTASNKSSLHHYKKFNPSTNEESISGAKVKGYSNREKTLINNAMEIVKNRQKTAEEKKVREGVVELIEQKKEMFLVSMAHNNIEGEIRRLQKINEEKRDALESSKATLEMHKNYFNKYLDSNKQKAEDAQTKADDEARNKKNRDNDIKNLNFKLTSLKAEKSRMDEAVSNYKDHKEFLDKLAPKDWHIQKAQKRNEIIESLKGKRVAEQMKNFQGKEEEIEALISQFSTIYRNLPEKIEEKGGRSKRSLQNYWKLIVELIFDLQVENEDIEELEDFEDRYGIFFTNPDQLLDIFDGLERKNLVLIQSTQNLKFNLEELKGSFSKKKLDLDNKVRSLKENQEILKRQIENVQSKIRALRINSEETKLNNKSDEISKPFKIALDDLFKIFNPKNLKEFGEYSDGKILEYLEAVESLCNRLLKELFSSGFKIELIEKERINKERDRKTKERSDKEELKQKYQNEKQEKNKKKMMDHIKKRFGRIDMKRSEPNDKNDVQVTEYKNNDEEEEKKYFIE